MTELKALPEDERAQVADRVSLMWSDALTRSVKLMTRACRRLGYNPDELGADHLALLATVLLGVDGEHIGR